MSEEEKIRSEIVAVCRRLYEKGWVANHDGNASVRVEADRIIATPTAVSKGEISPEMLIVVDSSGKKIEGTRRSFSEFSLHLKAFQLRPDVKAVLHAHPVTACGFAIAGVELEPTLMPEAVVSIGDRIPTAPFALPFGEAGAAPLEGLLEDYDAVLLANHGVLTVGPDLWTAFFRLELVEHLARIQQVAMQVGQVNRLSEEHVALLLEKRTKAGLGPAARGRASGSSSGTGDGSFIRPGAGVSIPALPDGPAPSAWGGGSYPVSPCSGERPSVASDSRLSQTARQIPSNEELQEMLAREVKRVLGR